MEVLWRRHPAGKGVRRRAATLYSVVWEGFSKRMFEPRPEDVRKQTVWAFGRELQRKEQ